MRLGLVRLGLVKRCVRLSVGRRSRVRVVASVLLSVADGIAGEEIAVDGNVVGVSAAAVRLLVDVKLLVDECLVAGIRGWMRCVSGLRRVVRGRVRRMTRLWI